MILIEIRAKTLSLFTYTSAISRNRRIVDLVAAAAGVLVQARQTIVLSLRNSFFPIQCRLFLCTYDTVQAPPATVFLHDRQFQIPTECRFTVTLPQKVHV